MSEPNEPRTWRFWLIWAAVRVLLLLGFYSMGAWAACWFLLGAVWPEVMWFWKDDECRLLRKNLELVTSIGQARDAENAQLRELAWRRQEGHPVVSSICRPSAWPSAAWSWHMPVDNSQEQQHGRKR